MDGESVLAASYIAVEVWSRMSYDWFIVKRNLQAKATCHHKLRRKRAIARFGFVKDEMGKKGLGG
jgi:hypothetical protein